MKILVVMPVIPYPPRKNGFTVRYYPLLDYLSRRHTVDLVAITDPSDVEEGSGRIGQQVNRMCIIDAGAESPPSRWRKVATHVRARLPWKTPLEFLHYEARDHVRQIAQFAGNQVYDAVIWVSPLYADYIRYLRPAIRSKRWIIDFIDSPSLHKSRRLGALRLDLAQWQMLLWEARMIRSADMSVYVSPVDAGTVPRALSGGKVPYVIPNGTYIDDYSEGRTGSVSPFSIGFLGHMGYPPNIQAAMKLYEHIYRPLKKRLPELELYIIGRAPPEQVKALAKEESVCVTGSVESIWPFLNAVSVFVLPLDTGAGQQNKIIEIMHAGRPVIASRIANGGIGAVHGQHMVVCGKNLDGWVEAAYDLLTNREKAEELGRAGRQFAMERYTWSEICPQFESLIGDVSVDAGPTGNIQLIQDGVRLRPASQGK